MHTELANTVIHMKIDLICKAYDFQNATFFCLVKRQKCTTTIIVHSVF